MLLAAFLFLVLSPGLLVNDKVEIFFGPQLNQRMIVNVELLGYPIDLVHDPDSRSVILHGFDGKAYFLRSWGENGELKGEVVFQNYLQLATVIFRHKGEVQALAYHIPSKSYRLTTLNRSSAMLAVNAEILVDVGKFDKQLNPNRADKVRRVRSILGWGPALRGPLNSSSEAQIQRMWMNARDREDKIAWSSTYSTLIYGWESATKLRLARKLKDGSYAEIDVLPHLRRGLGHSSESATSQVSVYGVSVNDAGFGVGVRIASFPAKWKVFDLKWGQDNGVTLRRVRDGLLARPIESFR